jgi:Ca2+-binding EF-hand superfamily protein
MSVTGSLSRTEQQDLLHMFELFDTEKRGSISLMEFKTVLEQVASEKEHRPALERVLSLPVFQHPNNNQRITQDEFVQLLTTTSTASDDGDNNSNQQSDEVRRVFDLFDIGKKGFISVDDLRRVAADLGENMREEELEEMIQRAAAAQEGGVTLEDFEAVLNHQLMSSF